MRAAHCTGPFRLYGWTLLTLILLFTLWLLRPEQMPVILYKLSLVTFGCVLGYWIDRALFPYARPHTEMPSQWEIKKPDGDTEHFMLDASVSIFPALLMIRRTVVVFACVLGLTLGL